MTNKESIFKHGLEIEAAWPNVELFDYTAGWGKPSLGINDYSEGTLNDPKRFRVKREPRRLFLNIHNKAHFTQGAAVHSTVDSALAGKGSVNVETVEFVEVLK